MWLLILPCLASRTTSLLSQINLSDPAEWERDFTSPKIYVYPLPYYLATCDWDAPENPWNLSIYGVETMLPPRIRNSQHVTHDPEEADFFYVPTLFYCNLDSRLLLPHSNFAPDTFNSNQCLTRISSSKKDNKSRACNEMNFALTYWGKIMQVEPIAWYPSISDMPCALSHSGYLLCN